MKLKLTTLPRIFIRVVCRFNSNLFGAVKMKIEGYWYTVVVRSTLTSVHGSRFILIIFC